MLGEFIFLLLYLIDFLKYYLFSLDLMILSSILFFTDFFNPKFKLITKLDELHSFYCSLVISIPIKYIFKVLFDNLLINLYILFLLHQIILI